MDIIQNDNIITINLNDLVNVRSVALEEELSLDEIDEGMECEFCGVIHEGTCGYTQTPNGRKLPTPGGTNRRGTTADVRTNFMRDSNSNPFS